MVLWVVSTLIELILIHLAMEGFSGHLRILQHQVIFFFFSTETSTRMQSQQKAKYSDCYYLPLWVFHVHKSYK